MTHHTLKPYRTTRQIVKPFRNIQHTLKANTPTQRTINQYTTLQQSVQPFRKTTHAERANRAMQRKVKPYRTTRTSVKQNKDKQRFRDYIDFDSLRAQRPKRQHDEKLHRTTQKIVKHWSITKHTPKTYKQSVKPYRRAQYTPHTYTQTPTTQPETCHWDHWGCWSGGSQTCGTVTKSRRRECVCSNGYAYIGSPKGHH